MDYQQGKVYRIDCLTTGDVYIGSTTKKTLAMRLSNHKSDFKKWKETGTKFVTSFPIIERGNYQITLIESVQCNSKDELRAREGFYIRTLDCVNKIMAGRTKKEYRQDNKIVITEKNKQRYDENKQQVLEHQREYYEANKEKRLEYQKRYCEANKEEKKEYNKKYCEANKEEIKEYNKNHYETHKDKINARRKELYKLKKEEKQ